MRTAAPELSVVVLCYGSGDDAHRVIDPLHEQLERLGVPFELVLVGNFWPGRGDRTPDVVEAFAAGRDEVVAITLPKEGPNGWDLRSGLARATGRYVVYLDGDGQVPVEYVADCYRRLVQTGADVVKGRRTVRGDGTARGITTLVYNALFRVLFGTRGLWDINGQPKGVNRDALERLDLRTDDWFIEAELVLNARARGLRIVEFPVTFRANVGRSSLVGVETVLEFLRNMALWRLGLHPAQRAARRQRALASSAELAAKPPR